jgi:hypothetical protein
MTPFITRSDKDTVLVSACDFQMSTLLKAMRLPLQRHAVNAQGFPRVKFLRPCLPSFADWKFRGLRVFALVLCVLFSVLSLDRALASGTASHEFVPAQVQVTAAPGFLDQNFALSSLVAAAAGPGFEQLSAAFQSSDEDQAGDDSTDAELKLVWMEHPDVALQTVEPSTNQVRSFRLAKTKPPP